MRTYMKFKMQELKNVAAALLEIKHSINAKFENETQRLLKTISSKQSHESISLKIENLEKLSSELHFLEIKHGINLGQTIYHFMHSFHRN